MSVDSANSMTFTQRFSIIVPRSMTITLSLEMQSTSIIRPCLILRMESMFHCINFNERVYKIGDCYCRKIKPNAHHVLIINCSWWVLFAKIKIVTFTVFKRFMFLTAVRIDMSVSTAFIRYWQNDA